ncbi:MAG: uroporphyrinogen decarboxylase [Rhizobiales bacterium]|nr:uroporphyrinogen decarboxylase [Hyphomicrobiales bacterium]
MSESAFLNVLNGCQPHRRPIWFMRQAGRYLPEYRAVREKAGSFLDLCYNPKLAAEVTLQPLRRFDLDAAILFSDILVVPHAMGLELRFVEGEGPVLETVGDEAAVRALKDVNESEKVKRVCETVARVREGLPDGIPLIGFCGAPWTVASYMIEGGSSDRNAARLAAIEAPEWFTVLIDRLVENSLVYLSAQIAAGVQAIQIFDSWAGELAPEERSRWVRAPLVELTARLKALHPGIPVILFAKGIGMAHGGLLRESKAAAAGIEAEFDMADALKVVPETAAVQGNLDPLALLADERICRQRAASLARAVPKNRHIFNLGHGLKPETNPARLAAVIDAVRQADGG